MNYMKYFCVFLEITFAQLLQLLSGDCWPRTTRREQRTVKMCNKAKGRILSKIAEPPTPKLALTMIGLSNMHGIICTCMCAKGSWFIDCGENLWWTCENATSAASVNTKNLLNTCMTPVKYEIVLVEYPVFHHVNTTPKPQAAGWWPYEVWIHKAINKRKLSILIDNCPVQDGTPSAKDMALQNL